MDTAGMFAGTVQDVSLIHGTSNMALHCCGAVQPHISLASAWLTWKSFEGKHSSWESTSSLARMCWQFPAAEGIFALWYVLSVGSRTSKFRLS